MTGADQTTGAGTPQLVEFGPCRVIGTRYAGKNEQGEIPAMWEHDFLPRLEEIEKPGKEVISFGICRCLPGASDGSFEYIAATLVSPSAPIPAGMVDAQIPAATYVVFPVVGLDELPSAWGQINPWLEAHPEWEGYCTESGCDCATHPGFELYPPTFGSDGKLFVYVPVRRKA